MIYIAEEEAEIQRLYATRLRVAQYVVTSPHTRNSIRYRPAPGGAEGAERCAFAILHTDADARACTHGGRKLPVDASPPVCAALWSDERERTSAVRSPVSKRAYVNCRRRGGVYVSRVAHVRGRSAEDYVFRVDGTAVCITDVIKITEVRAAMHNA